MNKITNLMFIVFACVTTWAADSSYNETYVSRILSEDSYQHFLIKSADSSSLGKEEALKNPTIKKLIEEGMALDDLVPPSIGVYKEFEVAKPFLLELGGTARPDFEKYAALDVNENPVAVLWSQCLLAYEGAQMQLSIPRDFRALLLSACFAYPEWPTHLAALGKQYVDERMLQVVARLFLDATKKLTLQHFNQPYYDQVYGGKSYRLFWDAVCGYLVIVKRADDTYVRQYLKDLVLLKCEIGRALYDEEWLANLQRQYKVRYPGVNVWGGYILQFFLPELRNEKALVQGLRNDEALLEEARGRIRSLFEELGQRLGPLCEAGDDKAIRMMGEMTARLRGYGAGEMEEEGPSDRPLQPWGSGAEAMTTISEGDLRDTLLRWYYYLKLLATLSDYKADRALQALLRDMFRQIEPLESRFRDRLYQKTGFF